MKVYKEAVYNALDAYFQVNPTINPRDAWLKLEEVLDSYFHALGGCERCFGKGYVLEETWPRVRSAPEEMFKLCTCERGVSLGNAFKLETVEK